MAYTNKYFLEKRAAVVRLASRHYEPGRQDRNYRWVWRTHIYPVYRIQYKTFMLWVAAEKKKAEPPSPSQ